MRDVFFKRLYEIIRKDPSVILIIADTGGFFCQPIKDRLINVGIAEQNAVGIAAGLAHGGKRPFLFNMLSFASFRCYEQIRIDLCCANLPVTIVGTGPGFDYSTLGATHHATEDISVMRNLPDITILNPSDDVMAEAMVDYCAENPGLKYLRLDRTGTPLVYDKKKTFNLGKGYHQHHRGKDLCIIATGRMVTSALELAKRLRSRGIMSAVIDLFRIKPIRETELCKTLAPYKAIVTIEEHFVSGGMGSVILEVLANNTQNKQVMRIGIPDEFCRVYGDRSYLLKYNGLNLESMENRILALCPAGVQ
jgi:transketolase